MLHHGSTQMLSNVSRECLGKLMVVSMFETYLLILINWVILLDTVDGSEIRRSPPGMVLKLCK